MVDFTTFDVRDVADIGLQRTETLFKVPRFGTPSYRAWANGSDTLLMLEDGLRRDTILKRAWECAVAEWETFSSFVPSGGSLCDIGCGHALVTLAAGMGANLSRISLLDIERTEKKHHEYNSVGAGYSSLDKAQAFLQLNGFSGRIDTCNPRVQELPQGPFDCVISIISAGFHYPIKEYTNYCLEELRAGGCLIFDLRRGTEVEQEPALADFSAFETIVEAPKMRRIIARKANS